MANADQRNDIQRQGGDRTPGNPTQYADVLGIATQLLKVCVSDWNVATRKGSTNSLTPFSRRKSLYDRGTATLQP